MKLSILLILFFAIQNPTIRLAEYYDGEREIFDETAHYPFVGVDYSKAFTPTISEIEIAEKFISENYYEYKQNILDSFHVTKYRVDIKYKNPKIVIRKFYQYNRQYAGFINSSGERIIHVGLFIFSNRKKADQYFDQWKEIIFLGSGEFYEKNQDNFIVNISQNQFLYKLSVNK